MKEGVEKMTGKAYRIKMFSVLFAVLFLFSRFRPWPDADSGARRQPDGFWYSWHLFIFYLHLFCTFVFCLPFSLRLIFILPPGFCVATVFFIVGGAAGFCSDSALTFYFSQCYLQNIFFVGFLCFPFLHLNYGNFIFAYPVFLCEGIGFFNMSYCSCLL